MSATGKIIVWACCSVPTAEPSLFLPLGLFLDDLRE